MKKSKIIKALIIVIVAAGILTFFYVAGSDESVTPSYFVWADKTINIYDVETNTKKTYEFDEYNCHDIGKYYGGSFCCIGDKNGTPYALLFKNGEIEEYISLPFNAQRITVYHDNVFAFFDGEIYKINRQSQECKPIIDDVDPMFDIFYINENGDIAFLRETHEENNDAQVFALYVYSNNEEKYIGNVERVFYWQSNEKIAVRTSRRQIYEEDGNSVYSDGEFNDYIINVKTKDREKTKLFKEAASVVSWKQGSTAIITSYYRSASVNEFAGIVNIEANVQEASYYGNQTNKTVEQISSYFEWFEENPLEQQET